MIDSHRAMFFIAYPFVITSCCTIFFTSPDIHHDLKEELIKNEKNLKMAEDRLNKLSRLLSSEFTNKAPKDVFLENCNKLMEAEDAFEKYHDAFINIRSALDYWREANKKEIEDISNNPLNYRSYSLGNHMFVERKETI